MNKYISQLQSDIRRRVLRRRVRRCENLAAEGRLVKGSKEWFIYAEIKYGGLHRRSPRRVGEAAALADAMCTALAAPPSGEELEAQAAKFSFEDSIAKYECLIFSLGRRMGNGMRCHADIMNTTDYKWQAR